MAERDLVSELAGLEVELAELREERRRELARMLSGRIDKASLAHASELLVGGR